MDIMCEDCGLEIPSGVRRCEGCKWWRRREAYQRQQQAMDKFFNQPEVVD